MPKRAKSYHFGLTELQCQVPPLTQDNYLLVEMRPLKSSCADAGSVIQAATAGSRAFQVCTRTFLLTFVPGACFPRSC